MREQDSRLNESPSDNATERQLSSFELPPPRLDRDALMYEAGWAAAMAQQPAGRGAWMAPAFSGFLAATVAGLLAVVLWQSTRTGSSGDLVAQTPRVIEHAAAPPRREPAGQEDPPNRNRDPDAHGNRDTPPTSAEVEEAGQPLESEDEQSLAAGEAARAVGANDPWALVSTALAQRHGVRWDEYRQRQTHGANAPIAAPPPTVLQMMRETGAFTDHASTAPGSHPLLRLIDAS